jgi:hypothetical protein
MHPILVAGALVAFPASRASDARIGQPYPCIGGLIHAAAPPTAAACVRIEVNAKNSCGCYTGLKQKIADLHGRTVVHFQPLRMARCNGLVLFPELNEQSS